MTESQAKRCLRNYMAEGDNKHPLLSSDAYHSEHFPENKIEVTYIRDESLAYSCRGRPCRNSYATYASGRAAVRASSYSASTLITNAPEAQQLDSESGTHYCANAL